MARTKIAEGGLGTDRFNLPITLNGTDGSSSNAGDTLVLDTSADENDRLLYEGDPPVETISSLKVTNNFNVDGSTFFVEVDTNERQNSGGGRVGINDGDPDAILDVYNSNALEVGTEIVAAEAAVGGYTGSSISAKNTLGSASTFDLYRGITDSDGDASGPFTVFQVRGDGRVSSNRGKSLIGEHTTTGYLAANSATIIQIQDCFNDDCSLYRVVGSVGGGYDSEDEAQFRFLTSGTTSQDSGYYWAATGLDDAGTTNALQGANTNQATVGINRATTVALWFDMHVILGGGSGGVSFWGKAGYHDQGSDRGFTTFGGKNESISDATGIEFFADSGSGNLSLVNLTFYGYRLRQNTSGGHSTNAYGSD